MASTDELIGRIKRRLSRQNTDLTASILDELAQAKERLEKKQTLPKFLLQKADFTVASAGSEQFDLNVVVDRYLRMYNEDGLRYYNGDISDEPWIKVEKFESLDRLIGRHPGTGTFPVGYCLVGESIVVRPKPTGDVQYRLRFYQGEATTPAAGNTTLWTQKESELLIANAGMVLAMTLRDKEALAFFTGMQARAEREFFNKQIADEMADLDSSRGED